LLERDLGVLAAVRHLNIVCPRWHRNILRLRIVNALAPRNGGDAGNRSACQQGSSVDFWNFSGHGCQALYKDRVMESYASMDDIAASLPRQKKIERRPLDGVGFRQ
jgi:hypothetical protein